MKPDVKKAVLSAASNEIVGRIRLQKIFYLLEQLGMNSGYKFSYHHYGPFSADLSSDLDLETAFSKSISEISKSTNYGTRYSIYALTDGDQTFDSVGDLDFQTARDYVSKLKKPTSVIIELAATIHWLTHKEKHPDWRSELSSRKPEKCSNENIERALLLLQEVGLDG